MRWKISICLLLFTFLLGAGVVSYTSGEDSLKYQVIEMDSARLPVGKETLSPAENVQWVAPGEPWAKDLFPNSKLVWEREFDGKIRDIKVGGENMVVFWEKDRLDIISYLDPDGNILWEEKFELEQDEYGEYIGGLVYSMSMSEDGEHVIINSASTRAEVVLEKVHVLSYDKKGDLKWERGMLVYEPGLALSPKGDYAITTRQSGEEMEGFFRLFDNKTGEELWSDVEEGINWSAAWLNDSEVAYVKGKGEGSLCMLLLFDAKNLQAKWVIDIGEKLGGKKHYGIVWETPKVKTSRDGKLIAMVANYYGRRRHRVSLMLDNQGEILWHGGDFVTFSTAFSIYPKDLLIGCSGWTIELLDIFTGKKKWQTSLGRGWTIKYGFVSGGYLITSLGWAKKRRVAIFDLETGELQRKPGICDRIASIIPIVDSQNKLCSFILLDKDKKTIQKLAFGQ